MIKILVFLAALLLISNVSFAKKPPSVQFMNVAPLPGSGFALSPQGEADGRGAVQLNIPVAYTPGIDFITIGGYAGDRPAMFVHDPYDNGSAVIGMGLTKWPRFYISAMAVSTEIETESRVANAQLQIVNDNQEHPALAFGVQDLLNKEWDVHNKCNTYPSYYGVLTKKIEVNAFGKRNVYLTLGNGSGRFLDSWFGGVSMPINDSVNVCIENDGYQWNKAVFIRPHGRYGKYTITYGDNGQCGKIVGVQFTGKLNRNWSIPIFLFLNFQN